MLILHLFNVLSERSAKCYMTTLRKLLILDGVVTTRRQPKLVTLKAELSSVPAHIDKRVYERSRRIPLKGVL
jgi:hypothetical protein